MGVIWAFGLPDALLQARVLPELRDTVAGFGATIYVFVVVVIAVERYATNRLDELRSNTSHHDALAQVTCVAPNRCHGS